MSSDTYTMEKDLDLTQFVCRFLKDKGAVLETVNMGFDNAESNGMESGLIKSGDKVVDILLPKELADALDVEEYISVAPDTDSIKSPKDHKLYAIQFQSPLVDRIVSMAGAKPPFLQASLKFDYIKTQGFANLIKEQFEFQKIKTRITGSGETKARYLLLTCRFLAQSDEQKQGLLDFSFNLDTGAMVSGMDRMMVNAQKEYQLKNIQGYSKKEIKNIHKLVSIYGPDAVEQELVGFVQSMNRRFKRDSLSLDEYYNALVNEMKESLARTGISARLVEEREEKIALIPDELAAKKNDLLNKYSIKINFTPVAALAVTTPCVSLLVTLIAGNRKRDISMIYNPVTKQIDPLVCQSCGMSTYFAGLCKNMHLNCLDCLNQGCTLCL
ncbi:MAG: hypothetical protein U9N77_07815 [Thermodesulfobacteriota bacterium]|nr:hypothetical protein [Thermodesulfobacteriota bacterium]